jgi:hypothetical protein
MTKMRDAFHAALAVMSISRAVVAAIWAMVAASILPMTATAQTPAGAAELYVFRPVGLAGAGGTYKIVVDGRPFGALGNGQYFRDSVPAGPHVITVADFTSSASRFNAEPGRTYAFVVSFQPLKMLSPYSVEAISGDDVKKYAQQLTLNAQHESVLPANLTARIPDDAKNCAQLRVAIADTKHAEQDVQANRASVPVIALTMVISPANGFAQMDAEDAFKALKAREDKLNAMSRKKNCGG